MFPHQQKSTTGTTGKTFTPAGTFTTALTPFVQKTLHDTQQYIKFCAVKTYDKNKLW